MYKSRRAVALAMSQTACPKISFSYWSWEEALIRVNITFSGLLITGFFSSTSIWGFDGSLKITSAWVRLSFCFSTDKSIDLLALPLLSLKFLGFLLIIVKSPYWREIVLIPVRWAALN